jgi:glutaconate CoA-transferase subunit B
MRGFDQSTAFVGEFTESEQMVCVAARLMEDTTYFIGGGMPQLAVLLAQRLYAPSLMQVYEYGVIGPEIALPFERHLELANSKFNYRACAWLNMNWTFFHAAVGVLEYGMLGVNQIDQYGNINTTYLGGTWHHPEMRLSGSGGANEIASFCWRTIAVMMHEKRRFAERVDHITSPGFIDGTPGARERAGLPKGSGPYRVVTSKALFGYDDETRRMKLLALQPGVTVDEVLENMQFRPLIADHVEVLPPPTVEEARLLREEIDPNRIVLGKGKVIKV